MDNILLHVKTKSSLSNIIASEHQSIILVGKPGSNKHKIAQKLVKSLLQIESIENYPYYLEILPDGTKISIDQVREINSFLKLRVPIKSASGINRAIVMHQANKMTTEAQNALLKTLEEPPSGTCIILTTPSRDQLLETVVSRSQSVDILPVDKQSATEFYGEELQSKSIDSLYAISQGQPGLLQALITDQDHPLVSKIATAKSIFTKNKAERLAMVDEIAKDRAGAQSLLDAMLRITHASIAIYSHKNDKKSLNKWQKYQQQIIDCKKHIAANVQTKLALDNLFINI